MWITTQLNKNDRQNPIDSGVVRSSGDVMLVQGETEYREPERINPYGIISIIPTGEKTAMIGSSCIGTVSPETALLDEGEVMLFSVGGAEIILKRSGEVFINGQRFAPKEE